MILQKYYSRESNHGLLPARKGKSTHQDFLKGFNGHQEKSSRRAKGWFHASALVTSLRRMRATKDKVLDILASLRVSLRGTFLVAYEEVTLIDQSVANGAKSHTPAS